jgi:uncharacterized membrane protein
MKIIVRSFLEGLLILVPILTSVYIVYIVFQSVDGLLGLPIPGVGFIAALTLITVIGFLASHFFTRSVFQLIERLFIKLPLVKILYSSVKDLLSAFVGDKKSFNKPVVVSLTKDGSVKTLGFVTREDLAAYGIEGHVAIYLPQAYNFAGNLIVVPTESISPVSADSSDVMTFLVSGGVSGGKKER